VPEVVVQLTTTRDGRLDERFSGATMYSVGLVFQTRAA
jgi:hypothetical protein